MFKKILVANRGEIALRVICACKELGIRSVAIYSEADRNSLHVRFADEAICIGPPQLAQSYLNVPAVIRLMGEKEKARAAMKQHGVPIVPGSDGVVESAEEALEWARQIGFPVIVKATAGGGGRGMRIVRNEDELPALYRQAQSEASAAFGNGDLYLERYVENPRHIEFQVLGDEHGNVVSLGERECSIQRRHQKLL